MESKKRTKPIDGIIIHSMAEKISGLHAYDFLEKLGLSAHFLVSPNGDIINGVSPDRVAYHAGKSRWKDQIGLNSTFIGIEVLVKGQHNYVSFSEAIEKPEAFNYAQYESTAKICVDSINSYPDLTKDRILRHSTVSGKDVRPDPKIDPGKGFRMSLLMKLINEKT